ncbi:MAG TPA: hypothetical protein VFM37_13525 [Pseudonocardiaceae bacterium]|nr:hypothetical protein [Pseudonocardiaceae bacterium]
MTVAQVAEPTPVGRVTAQAQQVPPPGLAVQAVAAVLLMGLGAVAYRGLAGLLRLLGRVLYVAGAAAWHVSTWSATAVRLGWVDARDAARQRTLELAQAATQAQAQP